MNDLSGLVYDGEIYRWLKTFEDLKSFVSEVLNIKGKWKSPGGDVKLFTSEGEGEFVIKWYGPRSKRLVVQGDDAEDNLKLKFESFVNRAPSNTDILCETTVASELGVCNGVDEPFVSQIASLKVDIASLVDITSDLILEINSVRSKQKDLETVIRKQDETISKLIDENSFLTSGLLSLENLLTKEMTNNFITNSPTESITIGSSNDLVIIDKDQPTAPNINTSHDNNPTTSISNGLLTIDKDQPTASNINASHVNNSTSFKERRIHDESVIIVNDQVSVSGVDLGANSHKSVEATKLNKVCKNKPTIISETDNGSSNFNQSSPKLPKHLTPCPFLKKRGFCKKGTMCDFLHQKHQSHYNMQRPFYNPTGHTPPLPNIYYSPFPVDPCYFPHFRQSIYHPTFRPSLYPPPLMSVPTRPPTKY